MMAARSGSVLIKQLSLVERHESARQKSEAARERDAPAVDAVEQCHAEDWGGVDLGAGSYPIDDAVRFRRNRSDNERNRRLRHGGRHRARTGVSRSALRAALFVASGILLAAAGVVGDRRLRHPVFTQQNHLNPLPSTGIALPV